MAEIPRSLLSELTDEINALSGRAQRSASDALARLVADWETNGNGDIAALREAAYEVIEAACSYYADTVAAGRAAEFYDAVRKAQDAPGKYAAVAESLRDPQAAYGSVKAFMASVVKQGATGMFVAACVRRLDAEIRKAANMCVAHNVSKDPAKPRYARVPSGETCGFCLMLSSFGFNYKTKEAASHAHPKCDCRVVPSFGKGANVRGYDPDGMYDRFNKCLDALGGRDGLRAEWDAMPDAEREAYIKAHGNKAGEAFDKYVNKRMVEEIETRDPKWYATGATPKLKMEDGASMLPKEEKVVKWLAGRGYPVTFRATRSNESLHTSDLFIGTTKWEIKQPRGNGKQTIYHQFEEAALQSDRLVLDITEVAKPESGDRWDERSIEDEVKKKIRWHYKNENGDEMQFKEVMLITDGFLKKIKRGS